MSGYWKPAWSRCRQFLLLQLSGLQQKVITWRQYLLSTWHVTSFVLCRRWWSKSPHHNIQSLPQSQDIWSLTQPEGRLCWIPHNLRQLRHLRRSGPGQVSQERSGETHRTWWTSWRSPQWEVCAHPPGFWYGVSDQGNLYWLHFWSIWF